MFTGFPFLAQPSNHLKAKILVFDITRTFLHGLNLWMESFVIRQLLSRTKKTCCYWVVSIGWVIGPFSREDVAERMSQGGWDSEIMLMESNQLFCPWNFPEHNFSRGDFRIKVAHLNDDSSSIAINASRITEIFSIDSTVEILKSSSGHFINFSIVDFKLLSFDNK